MLILLLGGWLLIPAQAAIDVQEFSSDELRLRYQNLVDDLRCPMCQNQNLAGSDSPIAADLRREIARMLEQGWSDREIREFLVERYGTFILYRPPVAGATLWVWVLPLIVFALIVLVAVRVLANARQRALVEGDQEEIVD